VSWKDSVVSAEGGQALEFSALSDHVDEERIPQLEDPSIMPTDSVAEVSKP
jgi:hypothetical protein